MEQSGNLPEFKAGEALAQALKFGAVTGTTGLLLGSILGLYRSRHPRSFAIASGIQFFGYGSTFWVSRAFTLHIRPFSDKAPHAPPSAKDRLTASTIAGAVSGGFTGLITGGGGAIVPGMMLLTVCGYGGQRLHTYLDRRRTEKIEGGDAEDDTAAAGQAGWIDRIASMKWTGLQNLSDEEYAGSLEEKVTVIEAEIALIDEKIEELREEERRDSGGKP